MFSKMLWQGCMLPISVVAGGYIAKKFGLSQNSGGRGLRSKTNGGWGLCFQKTVVAGVYVARKTVLAGDYY